MKEIFKEVRELAKPFRVTDGDGFRLKDIDPGDTLNLKSEDKPRAKEALAAGVQALASLQDVLHAQDRWGMLLIFQAMDAAGKDSAIKHVMSGVNPQGVEVYSFKSPSPEDLDHDYLWRCMKFYGDIKSVDEAAKTIVVARGKESKTFAVDEKTKITRGKDTLSLGDLKQGLSVSIEFKKETDKLIAVTIKAAKPKGAPEEK